MNDQRTLTTVATGRSGIDEIQRATEAVYSTLEDGTASPEQFEAAIAFKQSLEAALSACRAKHKQSVIAWLSRNGDYTAGENRYYVGTVRDYKCRDAVTTAERVLEAVEGDLERFLSMLSSNSWKPGAVRDLLGQAMFDVLFETVVKEDPKTGKPVREPKVLNAQFARGGNGGKETDGE